MLYPLLHMKIAISRTYHVVLEVWDGAYRALEGGERWGQVVCVIAAKKNVEKVKMFKLGFISSYIFFSVFILSRKKTTDTYDELAWTLQATCPPRRDKDIPLSVFPMMQQVN